MNILVVGRGGREHSIIMKLAENNAISQIYAAPGNGGIAEQATCVDIDEMEIDRLTDFAKTKAVDLTIVGPENPLLAGIANEFKEKNLAVFAPTKEAALLEGSKRFAKQFMLRHDIPTADYAVFSDAQAAKQYISRKGAPIVVKADGLAAGKGVVVAETINDAHQAVDDMLVEKSFAEAGTTIVIEEFLQGEEFSLMAFVHENNVYPMVPARDHKRAFDHDKGPNTGGMGAYAPVEDITAAHLSFAKTNILQKTADSMVTEGRSFTGILYAGLIMTAKGPKVIEFNVRFGDPETEVVLPLLSNDLLQVLTDVMNGDDPQLDWEKNSCAGVVLASAGYPATYNKGVPVKKLNPSDKSFVVHAGTKLSETGLVSDGGRVLLAGAKGATLAKAAQLTYQSLACYAESSDFFYRTDIGKK